MPRPARPVNCRLTNPRHIQNTQQTSPPFHPISHYSHLHEAQLKLSPSDEKGLIFSLNDGTEVSTSTRSTAFLRGRTILAIRAAT